MPTSSKSGSDRSRAGRGLIPPPWARVSRVQLIRREIREYLAADAIELLLGAAEYVVEGAAEAQGGGTQVFATVMATVELRRCSEHFREPADAATAQRVAELMQASPRVRARLIALAKPRLARLAGVPEHAIDVAVDPHVRAESTRILIDADAVASPASRRRS